MIQNKIQLITYADSFGKNIKELHSILNEFFKEEISGIHLLPFFPSSSDRGFSPVDYFEVDPNFGDWEDVKNLAEDYDLTCDLIINHISRQSKYFQDFLEKGEDSKYKDCFITPKKFNQNHSIRYLKYLERRLPNFIFNIFDNLKSYDFIFHEKGVSKSDLEKIYRRHKNPLFYDFETKDGKKVSLYCTFSPDQIDWDIENTQIKKIFKKIIDNFAENKIKAVRLDAIAYAAKKRGTSSFFIDETYDFIKWLGKTAHDNKMEVLPEVHFKYPAQLKLAETKGVDYVYDFALPLVVLHTIFSENDNRLKEWINIRPNNAMTVLDTHDGIDVSDVGDLLSEKEVEDVREKIFTFDNSSAKTASGLGFGNTNINQINTTFYCAVDKKDDDYINARIIQYFIPGTPQVFYTGLLAGGNDLKRLYKTNTGREIMRHNYTRKEIEKRLQKKVVQRLLKLSRFRNTYSAFNGKFTFKEGEAEHYFIMRWEKGSLYCEAHINLKKHRNKIKYIDLKTGDLMEESF